MVAVVCPKCKQLFHVSASLQNRKPRIYCSNICVCLAHQKAIRPPIDQLKEEIKQNGYCSTARKYGVSDNAIRKWLKMGDTGFGPVTPTM